MTTQFTSCAQNVRHQPKRIFCATGLHIINVHISQQLQLVTVSAVQWRSDIHWNHWEGVSLCSLAILKRFICLPCAFALFVNSFTKFLATQLKNLWMSSSLRSWPEVQTLSKMPKDVDWDDGTDTRSTILANKARWCGAVRNCDIMLLTARPCNDFVVLRRVRNCLRIISIISSWDPLICSNMHQQWTASSNTYSVGRVRPPRLMLSKNVDAVQSKLPSISSGSRASVQTSASLQLSHLVPRTTDLEMAPLT